MQSLRAATILLIFLLVTLLLIPWQETAVRFKLKRRKTFPNFTSSRAKKSSDNAPRASRGGIFQYAEGEIAQ